MQSTLQGNEGARGDALRVLVVNNDSLFGEGIESILRSESELVIRGITTDDAESLLREIDNYEPNVIVLVEEKTPFDTGRILPLFDQYPALRIVGVSLQSGQVRAYDQKHTTITGPADFLEIIRGCA